MTNTWTCWRDGSHTTGTHELGWPVCRECGAAPDYWERPKYLRVGFILNIYVPGGPDAGRLAFLEPRTAIVGVPDDPTVYYEGFKYGTSGRPGQTPRDTWVDAVEQAASRLVTAYPTTAKACLPATALVRVGIYDPRSRRIAVDRDDVLDAWLA